MIRGIRNNNWGNVELGAKWKGLATSQDVRFCTFKDPIYGLRAIIKITQNYHSRHNIKSVKGWVNRWAPAHENNVVKYKSFIELNTKSKRFKPNDKEYMRSFVKAVCQMECGVKEINKLWNDWYFDRAWDEAN